MRFEAIASYCTWNDDEAKDVYVNCLKPKFREALATHTPKSLEQAICNAIRVDVNLSRFTQAALPSNV